MSENVSLKLYDSLIGFKKPASKTADWIVDTYLRDAPVSHRVSIEQAIAAAVAEVIEPLRRELLSQPAPRTYEVARALATLEALAGIYN